MPAVEKRLGTVPDVPPELREAHTNGRLIPFVGAGLSCAIVRDGEAPPPSYKEFLYGILEQTPARDMNKQLRLKIHQMIDQGEYKSASQNIRRSLSEHQFGRIVRSFFKDIAPEPSQHHTILNMMGFRTFLTTNYDRILDQVIHPRPEIYTYHDFDLIANNLNATSSKNTAPIILKLNGDISRPNTIALGKSDEIGMWQKKSEIGTGLRTLFKTLLREYSVLFLGYSFSDPDYRHFLISIGREIGPKIKRHFAVVLNDEWETLDEAPALMQHVQITPLTYTLAEEQGRNPHRGIWQFLSQIPVTREIKIAPGINDGSFYLPKDRPRYLSLQNAFEKKADAFRYLTANLTNAVTTEAYLERFCREKLVGFRHLFAEHEWDDWCHQVLEAMKSRMDTLEDRLQHGAEMRVLCRLEDTLHEIANADSITLERYQKMIRLTNTPDLDIEVRLCKRMYVRRSVGSFASLLRGYDNGADVAVAYATQATTADFATHIFEINSQFAEESMVCFEKEWVRALDEKTSRNLIQNALEKRHLC